MHLDDNFQFVFAGMQDAMKQDITRKETTETEVENEIANSAEESDSSKLTETLSTEELKEGQGETEEKYQRKSPSCEETQKENMSDSG